MKCLIKNRTLTNDLHELRKKREEWVESSRENGFTEGIKHLLTDLYPDNAHFIYELLQNAEDAGASEVRFVLTDSSVTFEHNGNRLFSAKDVDSITSLGSSTKRDDPTNIGKFGIGFKAVFAYTTTPEIESGEYHFRIRDMVVPDTEELDSGALGERKTRFIFPFNHPKKPSDKARTEIEKNLRQLNENTLLFLSNIRKIEYDLPDDSGRGYLERRENEQDRNQIEISAKRPIDLISNSTHYLRFEKVVSIRDEEDNKLKDCRIAIAFGMEHPDGRGWKITSLNSGQVCIYFPAIKETSNLRFHLHAPFASTVARDSIRECPSNTELLNHLANLIAESMSTIRDQGLLDVEFLAVLPNYTDFLSAAYLPIRERLIETFKDKKLTPMKQGGHAAASGIYREESQLSSLIQDEDLATLLGKDTDLPLWVAEPRLIPKRDKIGRYVEDAKTKEQNWRISNFLTMLNIPEWTIGNFIEVLKARGDIATAWLKKKSDDWHQRLYALLGDSLSRPSSYSDTLRIVRCKDGNYRPGSNCHFSSDDVESDTDLFSGGTGIEKENQSLIQEDDERGGNFHYVAKGVYSAGEKKDQQEKVRKFLKTIGVREVDEAEQVKIILKQRYVPGTIEQLPKPHHKRDLERFIALVEKEPDQAALFKDYLIFELDNGDWRQPNHAFVDSPYLDTSLTVYYETISKYTDDFRRALSPNYRKFRIASERFGKFAEAVGAQTKLEAKERRVPWEHPEGLRTLEGNQSNSTRIDRDYTIPRFKQFLNQPSINKARLIWRTMNSMNKECLEACFLGNYLYRSRVGASSLVHNLRDAKWVPQQKDSASISFVCPCDALQEYLPEGFAWPEGPPHDMGEEWLNAIEFGKIDRKQKAEYIHQNQRAQEMGFNSGDEAEKMVEFSKTLKALGQSPEEVLDEISTEKRRAEGLIIELSNAEEKQYEIRARNTRVTLSTIDPRTFLREQYTKFNNMKCQMCRQEMPFKKRNSDDDYFEAVEALRKDYFPIEHEAQHLALCPECAAKYKEYVKKDRTARKDLYNILKDSDNPDVRLELNDCVIHIWFDEKHWNDLKTILCYYECYYENRYKAEDSTN